MSDIHLVHVSHPVSSWLNQAQIEIQQRLEWHGVLSEEEAEERLKLQPPKTYLLREADQQGKFYLSFVQSDLKIDHQYFMMDGKKKKWFYKNGDPHHITSLQLLIPQIMHCHSHECIPLKSV
jgi:hypothetical protein